MDIIVLNDDLVDFPFYWTVVSCEPSDLSNMIEEPL